MINANLQLTDLAEMEALIGLLRGKLSSVSIPEEAFFDIQLAVTEAVNNAFIHGSKNLQKTVVEIEYWIDDYSFKIKIKDNGAGFDYRQAGKLKDEDILAENGKGLFLIFNVVDDVWFNATGNEIYCLKRW